MSASENLPKIYLNFYRQCELYMPNRLQYVELRNSNPLIQSDASQLLTAYGYHDFLSEDQFVFMMINDYCFFYFNKDGNNDPEVFLWSSRLKGSRSEGRLSNFLESYSEIN